MEVGSLIPSFLNGKLFVKDLIIYTQDYSISIHLGVVQFRYWTRKKPFDPENVEHFDFMTDIDSFLAIRADGVQCLIFNNVEAYKNLEAIFDMSEVFQFKNNYR